MAADLSLIWAKQRKIKQRAIVVVTIIVVYLALLFLPSNPV